MTTLMTGITVVLMIAAGGAWWRLVTRRSERAVELRQVQQLRGVGILAIAFGSIALVYSLTRMDVAVQSAGLIWPRTVWIWEWNPGPAGTTVVSRTYPASWLVIGTSIGSLIAGLLNLRQVERNVNWMNHLCPMCEYHIGDSSTCPECGHDHTTWS